jgi:hypothetical protein
LTQTSNDVYSLIDPDSDDDYGNSRSRDACVRSELCDPVAIDCVRIQSAADYFRRVFRNIYNEHRNEIRKSVSVPARDFDLSVIHEISPRMNVCTHTGSYQWVQAEFVDRKLLVSSYRLKRGSTLTLCSWSLRGSNDPLQPLYEWTKLDSRHETNQGEFDDYQCFSTPGGSIISSCE